MWGNARTPKLEMGHGWPMLHDFLTSNRDELIKRCRAKVAKRSPTIPAAIPAIAEKGVPLFLAQLVETLRREQLTAKRNPPEPEPTPAPTEIGRAAAWHGADLLRRGYTVDQVVHDYGDVCQSVTDMVVEQDASVSADEFRTLNRCLDNAIADAVTAYASSFNTSTSDQAKKLRRNAGSMADEEKRLIDIAIQMYDALKGGSVALNGATGTVLGKTLGELRGLIEQSQSDNRPLH
jgi:hypothetical protein